MGRNSWCKDGRVEVRLSTDERKWLAEIAASTGETMSKVIRRAIRNEYVDMMGRADLRLPSEYRDKLEQKIDKCVKHLHNIDQVMKPYNNDVYLTSRRMVQVAEVLDKSIEAYNRSVKAINDFADHTSRIERERAATGMAINRKNA